MDLTAAHNLHWNIMFISGMIFLPMPMIFLSSAQSFRMPAFGLNTEALIYKMKFWKARYEVWISQRRPRSRPHRIYSASRVRRAGVGGSIHRCRGKHRHYLEHSERPANQRGIGGERGAVIIGRAFEPSMRSWFASCV
jgi:hypothetical protein